MMPLLKPEERSPTIILTEALTKNAGQCVPVLDLLVGDGPSVLDLLAGDGPSALDLLAGDGPSVLDLLVDLEDCRRAEVGPVSIKIPVHVPRYSTLRHSRKSCTCTAPYTVRSMPNIS